MRIDVKGVAAQLQSLLQSLTLYAELSITAHILPYNIKRIS